MEFSTKALDWVKAGALAAKGDCPVVGLFELQTLADTAGALDVATKGLVAHLVKLGDFEGKRGTSLLLYEVAGVGAARVLLVGLDKGADFIGRAYIRAVRTVLHALANTRTASVTWTLTEHTACDKDTAWAVLAAVTLICEANYCFIERHPELKSKHDKNGAGLCRLVLAVPVVDAKTAGVATACGTAIANGMSLMYDLGNPPSNICTPTYLANTARQAAKDLKFKAEVLGRKQIETLKVDTFLTVTRGSAEPPAFIVLCYEGGLAKQTSVVLVGKGITFGTSGVSPKSGEDMNEMGYDVCGVASVLDTLHAVAETGLKQNVIAVVPTCEDTPSGIVTKPGDMVTSMSGQTIRTLDTDAESRLIFCDTLTCVERFRPAVVIDVVTFTDACIIVLGHINTGIYAHSDILADVLIATGKQSFDTA